MINLLPPKEKKEVFNEKKERTILTLMFFLVLFLKFSTATFYIVRYYSLKTLEEESQIFTEEMNKLSNVAELEKDIEKMNTIVLKVNEINDQQLDLESVFEMIKTIIPNDIKLNNFEYKKNTENDSPVYEIILSGQASDWQSLLIFEESLMDNFSNVNFSEDSWAQAEDINFLVKFKIDEKSK